MKTSDFYYDLPKELIAQTPAEPRDSSRLLVLDRQSGETVHKHFFDIIDYLDEGDLLVCNDCLREFTEIKSLPAQGLSFCC